MRSLGGLGEFLRFVRGNFGVTAVGLACTKVSRVGLKDKALGYFYESHIYEFSGVELIWVSFGSIGRWGLVNCSGLGWLQLELD